MNNISNAYRGNLLNISYQSRKNPIMISPNTDFSDIINRVGSEETKELSQDKLKDLSTKYDINNMSGTQKISFLGDLVGEGILSKQQAIDIAVGFVPGEPGDPAKSRMTPYNGGMDEFGYKGNGMTDYMQFCIKALESFNQYAVKNQVSEELDSLKNGYSTFYDIISRMSVERNMA